MAESTDGKGGILRKLILERDCWTNFDLNAEFEFKTVYHISEYSYTMCYCAFEHEYFDTLLESGEVDKEMLEKLIKCINDGACPHVQDDDDDKFIAKTTVHGIHALAALGDEKLLHTFNLNPAMLGETVWGAVLLFIPYLWISKIHFWISIIHFWISKNELLISLIILGYP